MLLLHCRTGEHRVGAQLGQHRLDLELAEAKVAQGGEDLGVLVDAPGEWGLAVEAPLGMSETMANTSPTATALCRRLTTTVTPGRKPLLNFRTARGPKSTGPTPHCSGCFPRGGRSRPRRLETTSAALACSITEHSVKQSCLD